MKEGRQTFFSQQRQPAAHNSEGYALQEPGGHGILSRGRSAEDLSFAIECRSSGRIVLRPSDTELGLASWNRELAQRSELN